jgi:hypothetical protein
MLSVRSRTQSTEFVVGYLSISAIASQLVAFSRLLTSDRHSKTVWPAVEYFHLQVR